MQFRVLALCALSAPSVIALSGPTSDALPAPWYKYDVLPNRPNLQEAKGQAAITGMASQWNSLEATAFATQAAIALDTEAATRGKLLASTNELKLTAAATNAAASASRVNALRQRAQAVSLETRQMIDGISTKTNEAVQRAIDDAVNAAIARMNGEVAREAGANDQDRDMVNTAAYRYAADRAQAAALPLQKAKLRKFQKMYDDISQEQSLGVLVNELKKNADGMATQAAGLQRQGETVIASELHSQAKDLLAVAGKVVAQASAFHGSADQARLQLNDGDAAAKAAAAYASLQASLNATRLDKLPPPPAPLTLPPNY